MSAPRNSLESRLSERLDGVALETAIDRMRVMPRYATEWERRVVAIGHDAATVDEAIAQLRRLQDPATCPPEWLFLLAWDNSVDVWDADWPDDVKRRVIDASWEIHRFKGTRFAIRTAVEALGLRIDLRRWFDVDPPLPRATFEAGVYITDDTPVMPAAAANRLSDKAAETITRTKPLTRHFAMRFGHLGEATTYVGAVMRNRVKVRVRSEFIPPAPQPVRPGIAVGARSKVQTRVFA